MSASSKGNKLTIWTAEATAGAPGVPTAATGSITTVAVASLVDNETFTLDDGTTAVVFEFNVSGAAVITPGNVEVDVSGVATADEVRDAIVIEINLVPDFDITAVADGAATVALTSTNLDSTGNTTSSETVVDAGFAVTDMTGGIDLGGVAFTWAKPRHRRYVVEITGEAGAGDITLTGPVYIYGWDDNVDMWYTLGKLNGGADVVVGARGFAEVVNDVGIYDRVGLGAAAISSDTVDATITELVTIGNL